MTTVHRWTGREAKLLREASRLSIRDFADRLGVGARTINKWEARLADITPLPQMQQVLDTALAQATDDVKACSPPRLGPSRPSPTPRTYRSPPASPPVCASLPRGTMVPIVVNGHLVLVRITADTMTALGLDAAIAQSGTAADAAEAVRGNPPGSSSNGHRGTPRTPPQK